MKNERLSVPKKKAATPEQERKRKPVIDPQVHKVIDELREWANKLPPPRSPQAVTAKDRLLNMADRLELSSQAGFEDSYGYCQELIDPHIKADNNGMYSITKDSLIPSVNESLQYLLDFWKANKDKPGIDLCL